MNMAGTLMELYFLDVILASTVNEFAQDEPVFLWPKMSDESSGTISMGDPEITE